MTPRQRADEVVRDIILAMNSIDQRDGDGKVAYMVRRITAAIEAERERCAKVAHDAKIGHTLRGDGREHHTYGADIAAAIRAGQP